MKAYTISNLNTEKGMVGYKEINGDIPANTPVLIECSSANGNENLIQPLYSTTNTVSNNNILTGVYFSVSDWISGHYNYVAFDAKSHRILSTNAAGELVFNDTDANLVSLENEKDNYNLIKVIPHNTAYLSVSTSTPTELKVVNEATGINHVTLDADKEGDIYTLTGIKVRQNATSTEGLPQGIYIFKGKKVVVK